MDWVGIVEKKKKNARTFSRRELYKGIASHLPPQKKCLYTRARELSPPNYRTQLTGAIHVYVLPRQCRRGDIGIQRHWQRREFSRIGE